MKYFIGFIILSILGTIATYFQLHDNIFPELLYLDKIFIAALIVIISKLNDAQQTKSELIWN